MQLLKDRSALRERMRAIDRDGRPEPQRMEQIRSAYLSKPDFRVEQASMVSPLVGVICGWVLAVDAYDRAAAGLAA
jgi:hypothetical protein